MTERAPVLQAKRDTIVDARWLMSFSAALLPADAAGRPGPSFDTAAGPVAAHPLFVWAVEWPLIWGQSRELLRGLTKAESNRGVHFSERIEIYRPIQSSDVVTTTMQVVASRNSRRGAIVKCRFDTVTSSGTLCVSSWKEQYYRGAMLTCEVNNNQAQPHPLPEPQRMNREPLWVSKIPIAASEAHVYSEAARIWNPIHTDRGAALAAGLPEPILHGTATLGKAVQRIIDRHAAGDVRRVKTIACDGFREMIFMPSTALLRVRAVDSVDLEGPLIWIHFDVLAPNGRPAVAGGRVALSREKAKI